MAKPDKKQEAEVVEHEAVGSQEVAEQEEAQPQLTEAQLKHQKRQEKLQQKKQARAKENKKDNKAKAKANDQKPKTNKGKEIVGELKKVTWPTFGKVVKNTLLVIGIVLLCTAALFVVDRLFSWIYQLLVNGSVTNWL